METKSVIGLSAALVLTLVGLAQSQNPVSQTSSPAKEKSPTEKTEPTPGPTLTVVEEDYIIGPEDLLDIRVFEQPELSGEVRVSARGFIRVLPFPEPIKAAGLTEVQLADLIREKLTTLLRNPQVVVRVKESRSRFVAVLGAVRKPDRYEVVRGMRLLTVLAAAGGLTESAGQTVHIIRTGGLTAADWQNAAEGASPTVEVVDLRQLMNGQVEAVNIIVRPGDIVSVPEADQIFVTGNVTTPTVVRMRGDMTLTKAIAMAGGLKPHTQKSKITILRPVPGKNERVEIVVDLEKVERDHSQDPQLLPNDVVFVPSSSARNIGMAMLNAFSLGAASQLIWLLR
jgi:polysaccharide export outer membrane protein